MTVSQIDTSNITNAFVSGMKEDLDLYGNQYNWIVTSWTIGYIIGQWVVFSSSLIYIYFDAYNCLMQPSNFTLTRVRAHSKALLDSSCFGSTETYLTVFSSLDPLP